MTIHINVDLCTGCGACVETCPPQAICLMAGKAMIRPELCTACGDCVKMCVSGAITLVELPALRRSTAVQAPATTGVARTTSEAPGKIALWMGIAATVLEQHILPRLADAFLAALDRRLSRSRPLAASSAGKDLAQSNDGRGLMRRRRRRGDRSW
jgi:NAD-dependent dihydropyrimidine dehydrogenase PreA subunit